MNSRAGDGQCTFRDYKRTDWLCVHTEMRWHGDQNPIFWAARASLPLQHPFLSTHFHTFIPERIQTWKARDVFSTSASESSPHGQVHNCTHTQHTLWALVITGPASLLYPTAVHRAPSSQSAFPFHAWLLLGKPFLSPWVIPSAPRGSYKSSVLFF